MLLMPRFLLVFWMLALIIPLPLVASAEPSYAKQRINVRVYNGGYYPGGIVFHSFTSPSNGPSPCFPFGCGEIEGPFTNPDSREPDEIPACYYDQNDVLFFEKEGITCPYIRPASPNAARVEKRRQEWLRNHSPE